MIFKDKTVIITGGSEGVGAATARLFAEAGAGFADHVCDDLLSPVKV